MNSILWADDDADDLQLINELISRKYEHFEIIEVRNGMEALEYLEMAVKGNKLPSLVVLDINMPVLDGKEALVKIRKNPAYADIPIVVFTTSQSELDKAFCKKHNVQMITKPPTIEKLQKALDRVLTYCR